MDNTSCSKLLGPGINFRTYWRTSVEGTVQLSIVELRRSFALCSVLASGGELFTKTWLKILNWVGILGPSTSELS